MWYHWKVQTWNISNQKEFLKNSYLKKSYGLSKLSIFSFFARFENLNREILKNNQLCFIPYSNSNRNTKLGTYM